MNSSRSSESNSHISGHPERPRTILPDWTASNRGTYLDLGSAGGAIQVSVNGRSAAPDVVPDRRFVALRTLPVAPRLASVQSHWSAPFFHT